ncbi:hypothetical protein BDY21DRAFT_48832 [Lineolata rhizophorae]|uniref:Secreted protein n=1 Tax=Lineolata rhizophorae TaxID=578093 RepID=A0A6A6NXD0_9PEZI|nr:hypothetical protein BDY21DRAFT_48832 [Lineolata rhizophorae]
MAAAAGLRLLFLVLRASCLRSAAVPRRQSCLWFPSVIFCFRHKRSRPGSSACRTDAAPPGRIAGASALAGSGISKSNRSAHGVAAARGVAGGLWWFKPRPAVCRAMGQPCRNL